jgi:mono/diheme cytochrome c family protein
MDQIKYSAYALLLVLGISSVVLFLNDLSFPSRNSDFSQTSAQTTKAQTETVVNAAGKNLFGSNCQTCHALDKVVTGPGLRGIIERGPWTDPKNRTAWVHNPAATIPKFVYTKQLAEAFNGQVMPSFPQLTEKEIEDIFDYISHAQ